MLGRWWAYLDFGLKVIMSIFLFVMMTLTAADVIGRYVFNAPISGAFEIVQYLMAIVVFAALPVTTAADAHLTVSLMARSLHGALGRAHRILTRFASAAALLLIAWRMANQAKILDNSQQVSGYLQLPLAPIAAVMAAFAALAFLIMLAKLYAAVIGHDAPAPHDGLLAQDVD
jgi:TRAP-type C4-dicarboxylate transport system permease small subunit